MKFSDLSRPRFADKGIQFPICFSQKQKGNPLANRAFPRGFMYRGGEGGYDLILCQLANSVLLSMMIVVEVVVIVCWFWLGKQRKKHCFHSVVDTIC